MKRIKDKVFAKWIISYFVLMLTAIVFGAILYSYSLVKIEEKIENNQYQKLCQSQTVLEMNLTQAAELATGAVMLEEAKLLEKKTAFDTDCSMLFFGLKEEIQRMKRDNPDFQEVIFYFPKMEYVLTSAVCFQMDPEEGALTSEEQMQIQEKTCLRAGQLYELMERMQSCFLVTEDGNLAVSYTKWSGIREMPGVIAVIVMKGSNLQKQINIMQSELYLTDTAGNCLDNMQGSLTPEQLSELTSVINDEGAYHLQRNSDHYIMSLPLPEYGFTLINVLSRQDFLEDAEQLRQVLYLYLAVSILLGAVASYVLTKRHYAPIERLLHRTVSEIRQTGELGTGDVFEQLEKELLRLSEERREAQQSEQKTRSQLEQQSASYRLNVMLKGRLRKSEMEEEDYGFRYGNLEEQADYVLISFQIADTRNLFSESQAKLDEETVDLIYFSIQNTLQEIIQKPYRQLFGEVDGMLMCLLSTQDQRAADEVIEELIGILQQFVRFFREKMGVDISVSVSDCFTGVTALSECYRQIMELAAFREETGIEDELLQYGSSLAERTRVSGETAGKRETGDKGALLAESVKDYVDQHFQEQQMNVSYLSTVFEKRANYLSRVFQKKYQIGLLEYLICCRLDQGKQYLAEGISVTRTAELIGYYDSHAFIRAFKQAEGMTPGEFQKNGMGEDGEKTH